MPRVTTVIINQSDVGMAAVQRESSPAATDASSPTMLQRTRDYMPPTYENMEQS